LESVIRFDKVIDSLMVWTF